MKKKTAMPRSGVLIENTLSMALHSRGKKRLRWELMLLAVIGTVSVLFTFLTMFAPVCQIQIVLGFSLVALLFFVYHADTPEGTHYTLLIFLLCYAVFFYWKREELAAGMMHLMNAVYQTIYMTDWEYFATDPAYEQSRSVTMSLCFSMIPVTWLLGYAVMRFQNFFLCLLVTFPFVEIGFFFGIAPEHLPAAGLFAFWCGMGAAQLASGTGTYKTSNRSGFLRRGNGFVPVAGMRFLLTERAGILTALSVFAVCLAAEYGMHALGYERPDRVKEMRTDFQYYAASIDWSDLSTVFPFLKNGSGDAPEEVIELGRSDRREFENSVISSISFTEPPQGRTYLKYSTFQTYGKSRWRAVNDATLSEPIMDAFGEMAYYPPEFLYYSVQSLGYETASVTLTAPNETLARCVPYGYAQDPNITCRGDVITGTATNSYTVFVGQDYENLLLNTISYDVPAATQLDACRPEHRTALADLLAGREDEIVQFPQSPALAYLYYGGEDGLKLRAEAAVLAAAGYTDLAYDAYTKVPDTEEMDNIYHMFADIIRDFDARNATASETMIVLGRLRERLCADVVYSLAPGKTPPGEDYAAYFLLENRKGYCTHYATAGTLLARMAGIPARYCEGYLVDSHSLHPERTDSGTVYTADILDSNAHAWTEVYVDGFGWIPFEFTFSYFTPPELPTEPETEPVTEPISEDPTEASLMTQPVTTLVPVMVETETAATELPDIEREPVHYGRILIVLASVLVLCLLLLSVILWRRRVLYRRELALSDPIGDSAARYAWNLILERLAACDVNIQAGSTDALLQEILIKCGSFLTDDDIRAMLSAGMKLRYSPHGLSEEERSAVISAYDTLTNALYENADPIRKLWLKWFRHYV